MANDNAQTIVQQYHRAWTSGDIDTAMDLVADDIACRAPGGDLHGKEAYRGFIGGFAPMLTRHRRHRRVRRRRPRGALLLPADRRNLDHASR
ncbi:nuclear transport factor 2 family protein [Gulosibacter sediminis]|uniref:nuclear transport factor 2 family protein n=1 Tax=Gulosibacter sediminis TaxID=1729695 RepID=UPI001F2B0AFF|nr:nuclear transport factor 2 family protein [Gulosibacter sediminis]